MNDLNIAQMSSGFLLGLSIGYFFKKGFKLGLFILGMAIVAIFWFNSQDIIEVNNSALLNIFDIITNTLKSSYNFVYEHTKSLEPLGGASIIVGFLTGIKFG